MSAIIQEFSVPFVYPIYFTTGVFDVPNLLLSELLSSVVAAGNRIVFVIDAQLSQASPDLAERITVYCRKHNLESVENPLSMFFIPGGESVKGDRQVLQELLEYLRKGQLSRHSVVVVLGGGAVLDLVGCVTSVMWCGVRAIHIPTTLVAQSCVGHSLKHMLNVENEPNLLGVFTCPLAVINDTQFLDTLPQHDYLSGFGEIIKLAVSKDAELFLHLEQRIFDIEERSMPVVHPILERAVGLNAYHIAKRGDPFEHGSRRPLEFGYWLAWRLHALSRFQISYGDALLVGIQIDAMYSHISDVLPESELQRIVWLCGKFAGEQSRQAAKLLLVAGQVEAALTDFQQRSGNPLQLPFLKRIGEATEVCSVETARIKECIEIISQLEAE
jgi:3-dehydroquinate synthase